MAAEMTLDEARKWVDRARSIAPEFRNATESALIALDEAGQSGGAEAMREAAAKVVIHFRHESPETIARQIRALPVPPARTSEPAATTMVTKPLDVRHWPAPPGAKWTATVTYPEPGVTMGPGEPAAPTPGPTACDDCDGKGGFDGYGKPSDLPRRACETCDGTGRTPTPGPTKPDVKFDAEAALVAMLDSIAGRGRGVDPASLYQVAEAVQRALAAGRRGAK